LSLIFIVDHEQEISGDEEHELGLEQSHKKIENENREGLLLQEEDPPIERLLHAYCEPVCVYSLVREVEEEGNEENEDEN
jgi:hypothetical protein